MKWIWLPLIVVILILAVWFVIARIILWEVRGVHGLALTDEMYRRAIAVTRWMDVKLKTYKTVYAGIDSWSEVFN